LLGGGLFTGEQFEIIGESSTGKTQMCLSITLNVALLSSCSVAYIDTSNSFSANRIAQLYHYSKTSSTEEEVLSRIICFRVFDIFHLMQMLEQLKIQLENQTGYGQNLRLIIIDSLGSLISPILVNNPLVGTMGHTLMASLSRSIKFLAAEYNIAFLTTNFTVRGKDDKLKPALG